MAVDEGPHLIAADVEKHAQLLEAATLVVGFSAGSRVQELELCRDRLQPVLNLKVQVRYGILMSPSSAETGDSAPDLGADPSILYKAM